MNATEDFDALLEPYHDCLAQLIKGEDPTRYKDFYSRGDDATLCNPFVPVATGFDQISSALELAASNYADGECDEFELFAKKVTPELAYLGEFERYRAKVGGANEMTAVSLRVTSIFRPEEGTWKLVHRHADPISAPRPAESVIESG
jgi:ketosteroid isomerase-like protein